MKKIDYALTNVFRWVNIGAWLIFFESIILWLFSHPYEALHTTKIIGNLCVYNILSFTIGCLSYFCRRWGSYLYTLAHFDILTYLPIQEEEIKRLQLDSVEDYVYKVACLLNSTEKNDKNLWSFMGVKGVGIKGRAVASVMTDILYAHYGCHKVDSELWHYIQFVENRENSDALCHAFIQ